MSKIDLYNEKKQQILQLIKEVVAIFSDLNMAKEIQACVEIDKKLKKECFKVVVSGEMKVGKSTLINALLGNGDVLPAQSTPGAAVVNEIKFSKERFAVVHFDFPLHAPFAELAPNVRAYIESFKGKPVPPIKIKVEDLKHFPFAKAEVYWDLPICEKGVEIIESPGLNESIEKGDMAKGLLKEADAVVFVFTADAPLTLSEMSVIENDIRGGGQLSPIFVCNKMDHVKEAEVEVLKSYVHRRLDGMSALGKEGVCFVDAAGAMAARVCGDKEALSKSGLVEFETLLDGYVANRGEMTRLMQPAMQLRSILETATGEAIPKQDKLQALKEILAKIREVIKGMASGDIEFTPWKDDEEETVVEPQQVSMQPVVAAPIATHDEVPSQTFVVAPGTDVFERSGVRYYRISKCTHADDGCNGEIFIGNDGMYVCGKCGKKVSVKRCNVQRGKDADSVSFASVGGDKNYWMEASGAIALKAGLKWMNELTNKVMSDIDND